MLGCEQLRGDITPRSQADDAFLVWDRESRLQTAPLQGAGGTGLQASRGNLWAELKGYCGGTAKPLKPLSLAVNVPHLDWLWQGWVSSCCPSHSIDLALGVLVLLLTFDVLQQWNGLLKISLGNPDSSSNYVAAFVSQNQTAKARSSA